MNNKNTPNGIKEDPIIFSDLIYIERKIIQYNVMRNRAIHNGDFDKSYKYYYKCKKYELERNKVISKLVSINSSEEQKEPGGL